MKSNEIISLGKAEFERVMLEQKATKAPGPIKQQIKKITSLWRQCCCWLSRPFRIVKCHLKRHYHLHLMLRYEYKHWLAKGIFQAQDRRENEPKKVEVLFDSLPRKLTKLQKEMNSAMPGLTVLEQRKFRGQFIKIVREHRGLSREQTCRLLNSHKDFFVLGERHSSYWSHFPFNPAFIKKFEEDTPSLMEEFRGGFLSGIGFPTEAFTEWLSAIYCAEEEFVQFNERYSEIYLKQKES